ncbi:30S ribosomal protein S11 [bacterium]|nr:30S ribosomal protein S11 [bacterium]
MGKKRIVKQGSTETSGGKSASVSRAPRKRVSSGILFVEATYNNTKVSISDTNGNLLAWSSSGTLGFKGAKKGTPFAAAKVGETIAEKAHIIGMKEVNVIVVGVGSGREAAVRSFAGRGFDIISIKDRTPVPHNGPKPKKPRRV